MTRFIRSEGVFGERTAPDGVRAVYDNMRTDPYDSGEYRRRHEIETLADMLGRLLDELPPEQAARVLGSAWKVKA